MYISHGNNEDNLVKIQEVLQLVIISKNLMTFMVDIVVILKKKLDVRHSWGFKS